MRARRIALITSIVLAVSLSLLAVAAYVWAPRQIERRVVSAARARLGLRASVGDVALTTEGVRLEHVTFDDGPEGAVEGRLDRVFVKVRFRELLRNRVEVTRLEIGPGTIDVTMRERGLARIVSHVRDGEGSRAHRGGSQAERVYPPLELDQVELRVRDSEGALATAVLRSMSGGGGVLELGSSLLIAGEHPHDRLEARDVEVRVRKTDHLRIERIEASSLEVHWATPLPDDGATIGGRLVPRVRAALAVARRAMRLADEEDDAPVDGEPSWKRRLAPGFVAEVDTLRITGPAVSGADERFDLTAVRGTFDGRDLVRLSGTGQGARVGRASWDVRAEPTRGRAEGRVALTDVPLSIVAPLVPSVPWYPSERGRVSIDAELRAEGLDVVVFRGALELKDVALSHPRIAAVPVTGLGVRVESEATIHPQERRINLARARVALGEAAVTWTGEVEIDPTHYVARGALVLPETSCDAAVHAIPADVLGPLVGFGLAGSIAGRMDLDIDSRALDRTVLDFTVDDRCTFVSAPPEADVTRFAGPFLHQALEPDGTVFEMETGPGTARWVPLYAMSPTIIDAVLAHEDAAYYRHRGFAPWAIRDAVVRNLTEGRYAVGASTITMQLAKNLFLRREKTLVRKIQEVVLAWWLERALDKERILELYLNVIEYGPSVYGIGAASHWWFGRSAAALSPVEAALLAIILPAPKMYAGIRAQGELSPAMRARVGRFLRHMAAERRLDGESLRYALEELEGYRLGDGGRMRVHEDEPTAGGGFGGEHYDPGAAWDAP